MEMEMAEGRLGRVIALRLKPGETAGHKALAQAYEMGKTV